MSSNTQSNVQYIKNLMDVCRTSFEAGVLVHRNSVWLRTRGINEEFAKDFENDAIAYLSEMNEEQRGSYRQKNSFLGKKEQNKDSNESENDKEEEK